MARDSHGWARCCRDVTAIAGVRLLQPLEWAAYDRLFLLRPESPRDERILIVGVTEADLERWGSPFNDETLATLLETLEDADPRAIGLDFYRNLPVEPGHERLVELFETSDRIIGIEKQSRTNRGEGSSATGFSGAGTGGGE